jgi:tetratricopeptide (TPR) repeat protein
MDLEPQHPERNLEETGEGLFAEWLSARERGEERDFEMLVAEHPGARASLEELHRAWKLVSTAIGTPSLASFPDSRAFPDSIGRYRKVSLLGRGGQGEVWLAEDQRLGRRVALKLLTHADRNRMRRFAREAEITSRLDHPGICSVFESGEEAGIAYIAMRYVEGVNLAQWIASERAHWPVQRARGRSGSSSATPTPGYVERAVRIAARAARALSVAHEAGVLHRDIKPGNILLTKEEEPVLVDFGFAADTAGDHSVLTASAQFLGTPAYMSPEQILGKNRSVLDARTDVWSLGVTLYECVIGNRPFEGPTAHAILRGIGEDEPPSARAVHPTLSADLEVILATALEKERERRYQSAAALASDLEAWLAGRPIAARKISWAGRLARWARREPMLASSTAALALALPVVGALVTYVSLTRRAVLAGETATREQELEDLLVEGYAELGEGDPVRALSLFDEALERGGPREEALGGKAIALAELGRADESLSALTPLPRARAWMLEFANNLHDALERTDAGAPAAGAGRSPRTPLEHFLMGEFALSSLHSGGSARRDQSSPEATRLQQEAVRHLRTAMLAWPAPSALATFEFAHALGHAGDPAGELDSIVEAVRAHWPTSAAGRTRLAFAFSTRDPARSALLAREAIGLDPQRADAFTALGIALAQQGDPDGAVEAYDRALEIVPGRAVVLYNRALAVRKRGDLAGAVDGYRAALQIDSGDAAIWNNLGAALSGLGDIAGATAAHREAIRLDPGDAYGYLNLARDLQFSGELEAGLVAMRRGHELGSSEPGFSMPTADWVRDLEGLIEDRGRLDAWSAGTSEPPPPEEQVRLAESAYAMGRCELAAKIVGELLALHPELASGTFGGARTTAAYAAAWLGRGTGEEARAWRARALDWIQQELTDMEERLVGDESAAPAVREVLERWRANPGLRPLLDAEEIAERIRALDAELSR